MGLRGRAFPLAALSFALLLVVSSASSFFLSRQLARSLQRSALRELALVVSGQLSSRVDAPDLGERVSLLSLAGGARITVISPDGRVLADSHVDPSEMEGHLLREEVQKALRSPDGLGEALRESTTLGRRAFYLAFAPHGGEGPVFRISVPEELLFARARGLFLGLIPASLSFSFLSSLLVLWGARRGEGRAEEVLGVLREELSSLGLSWSGEEVSSLRERISELGRCSREEAELREALFELLGGARVGVLVFEGGVLRRFNDFAYRALGELKEGLSPARAIRVPEVVEAFHSARSSGRACGCRAEVGGRTLEFALLPRGERVLVAFLDATERANFEKLKRELVSSVSHELKTPLAIVRGYLEEVCDEVEESLRERIGVAIRHVDRLSALLSRLLTISQMEEVGLLEMGRVELRSLLERVGSVYAQAASRKGLDFRVSLPEGPLWVLGDELRLEEMVGNLLDNAVKYTDSGFVALSLFREGDEAVVEVSDSGVGIPEGDRARIFERFYVVDRSRSRSRGGFGLGLSIVKKVAERHGGRVEVYSRLGLGSTFRVFLPLALDLNRGFTVSL